MSFSSASEITDLTKAMSRFRALLILSSDPYPELLRLADELEDPQPTTHGAHAHRHLPPPDRRSPTALALAERAGVITGVPVSEGVLQYIRCDYVLYSRHLIATRTRNSLLLTHHPHLPLPTPPLACTGII